MHILCTCGEDGLFLHSLGDASVHHIQHNKKELIHVKDVTGCGDVVFAVFVVQYFKNNNMLESAKVANYIGGCSVATIGTYECNNEDIQYYYNNELNLIDELNHIHKRINFGDSNIIFNYYVNKIKKDNKKIIFTNGCFDIIHLGHLELLKYCKSLGDYLIIGLNSDSSVKRLKGQTRPINNVKYRSEFLSYLHFVDLIIVFDEDTPFELLKRLRPNILVKGGDYSMEQIIGREFAEEVIIHPFVEDYSSTNIIKKIKDKSILEESSIY